MTLGVDKTCGPQVVVQNSEITSKNKNFQKTMRLLTSSEVLGFAQNNMKLFVGIARSCFDCFRRFSNLVRSKIGFVNLAEIICFRDKLFSK